MSEIKEKDICLTPPNEDNDLVTNAGHTERICMEGRAGRKMKWKMDCIKSNSPSSSQMGISRLAHHLTDHLKQLLTKRVSNNPEIGRSDVPHYISAIFTDTVR